MYRDRALALKVTLCLLALFGSAGATYRWLSPPPAIAPAARPEERQAADEEPAGPESEVVTLLPEGFEPAEITRPRGEFLLVAHNRSGLDEVTWRLEREAGATLREVRLGGGRLRSGTFENLPPGTYLLSVDGHPEWVCRLTITP